MAGQWPQARTAPTGQQTRGSEVVEFGRSAPANFDTWSEACSTAPKNQSAEARTVSVLDAELCLN